MATPPRRRSSSWRCLYCGLPRLRAHQKRCLACQACHFVYGVLGNKDGLIHDFLRTVVPGKATQEDGKRWLCLSSSWAEGQAFKRCTRKQPEQITCLRWRGCLTEDGVVEHPVYAVALVDVDGPPNVLQHQVMPIVPSSTRINLRVPRDMYRAVQKRVRHLNELDGGRRTVTAIVVSALNVYAGMPDVLQEKEDLDVRTESH